MAALANLVGCPGNKTIIEIADAVGNTKRPKDIADVFAEFYEKLYDSRDSCRSHKTYVHLGMDGIPPFSMEELKAALKNMQVGKARDHGTFRTRLIFCQNHAFF